MKMRTVFAVMMLAAALLAVTALGIFVATIAEKDHAPHADNRRSFRFAAL